MEQYWVKVWQFYMEIASQFWIWLENNRKQVNNINKVAEQIILEWRMGD